MGNIPAKITGKYQSYDINTPLEATPPMTLKKTSSSSNSRGSSGGGRNTYDYGNNNRNIYQTQDFLGDRESPQSRKNMHHSSSSQQAHSFDFSYQYAFQKEQQEEHQPNLQQQLMMGGSGMMLPTMMNNLSKNSVDDQDEDLEENLHQLEEDIRNASFHRPKPSRSSSSRRQRRHQRHYTNEADEIEVEHVSSSSNNGHYADDDDEVCNLRQSNRNQLNDSDLDEANDQEADNTSFQTSEHVVQPNLLENLANDEPDEPFATSSQTRKKKHSGKREKKQKQHHYMAESLVDRDDSTSRELEEEEFDAMSIINEKGIDVLPDHELYTTVHDDYVIGEERRCKYDKSAISNTTKGLELIY